MNKSAIPFIVFVVIGNLITMGAIIYTGIDAFLSFWWRTSLTYIVSIITIFPILYLIWLKRIHDKKASAELSALEYAETLDANADKDLMVTQCLKCEHACNYFSKNDEDPAILICWSCRYTFSYVWCEKCGMGGDFVTDISQRPPSWKCPECQSTYAIPAYIYENPIKTVAEQNLPATVHASHTARQIKFQIDQATTSVWLFSSLLLSFTLVLPIMNSFDRALAKYSSIAAPELFYSDGGFFIAFLVFIATWSGLIFYPLTIVRKIKQLQNSQREQV